MSLIVDASVALKWFADEENSVHAEALLTGDDELVAPDLILAEVGNAMWKKSRKGLVPSAQVVAAMNGMSKYFGRLIPIAELAARAAGLATLLHHPIYDCFYLTLAERDGIPIITADERMLALGEGLRGIEIRAL
jgi:predicted nucleic acid-binding protein